MVVEVFIQTLKTFSQVDLRMTYSCFHRMRAVLASRPQLSCSHPSCFLTVSQHWKYTLESNNLSMMEMGWTDCSLCVKLRNQTSHYEPRCSMRPAPSKVFLQNSLLIAAKNRPEWRENQHSECFPRWVFKMSHSSFHRVKAVFLPADFNWQVHTKNKSKQCPSTENRHLGQTQPGFHEGSGVKWLFAGYLVA